MNATAFNPCDAAQAASAAPCASRHPRATLAATILGSSLAFIDGSVVNVALPKLASDLGASASSLPWIISAYLLPSSALILFGGACGDHFGRRRLFLWSVAAFLAASVLCALTPSLAGMLAGRTLQGVAAAFLMPNSLAILGSSFSGEEKGKAIGTWAGVGALAAALGPLVGGWLVDAAGWRWIFAVNLPVGLAAMWLAYAYVAECEDGRTKTKLDWLGAALITGSLACLSLGLAQLSSAGMSALAGGLVIIGCGLAAAFVVREVRQGGAALMPVFLMASSTFAGVTVLTFLLYAALGGLIVLLPYFLISIQGYSAVQAGAAMLPIPLLIAAGSRVIGGVTARIGGRLPLAIGSLLVALGLAMFLRVGVATQSYWVAVFPAVILIAAGMAVSVAPLTTTVMSCVDKDHVGAASGLNSAVARIGGLLATTLLGFVFVQNAEAASFVRPFHVAAAVGAALAACAAVAAVVLIKAQGKTNMDESTPANYACSHFDSIRRVTPQTLGCEECLQSGSTWFHLRVCRQCGHVGCCDKSPGKHATAHFRATGHPVIEGYDPPEGWGWCFIDEAMLDLGDDVTPQQKPIPRYY